MIQTATETTGSGDKRKCTSRVHTNEAYTGICVRWMTCFPVLTQRAKQPGQGNWNVRVITKTHKCCYAASVNEKVFCMHIGNHLIAIKIKDLHYE